MHSSLYKSKTFQKYEINIILEKERPLASALNDMDSLQFLSFRSFISQIVYPIDDSFFIVGFVATSARKQDPI
jgi:hypothetical protein